MDCLQRVQADQLLCRRRDVEGVPPSVDVQLDEPGKTALDGAVAGAQDGGAGDRGIRLRGDVEAGKGEGDRGKAPGLELGGQVLAVVHRDLGENGGAKTGTLLVNVETTEADEEHGGRARYQGRSPPVAAGIPALFHEAVDAMVGQALSGVIPAQRLVERGIVVWGVLHRSSSGA